MDVTEPELTQAERELAWVIGSAPQLQRRYPGRCLSCAFWTPKPSGNHGTCYEIPEASTDDQITVGAGAVTTKASFGCTLFAESDEAEREERTELAIRRNLMDEMPDDFSPDPVLAQVVRERNAEPIEVIGDVKE